MLMRLEENRIEYRDAEVVFEQGHDSREVYFILTGKAEVSQNIGGRKEIMAILKYGDFFGEIAVLTDTPRTADVVAQSRLTLLQVPVNNLEAAMVNPRLRYLFLSTLTERLTRTHMADLPRLRGLDQDALRELRLEAVGSTEY